MIPTSKPLGKRQFEELERVPEQGVQEASRQRPRRSTKSTYMRASSQPSEASEETPVPVQVPKVLSTDWKVRFWSLVNTGTAL
jgi:hypothetical protein